MKIRLPKPGVLVVTLVILAAFLPLVLHTIKWFGRGPGTAEQHAAAAISVPDTVPPGIELAISDNVTQQVFAQTGWAKELPFKIKWVAIAGGPAISEAMNAKALDAAVASDIPPIQSRWSGVPVRIIGIHGRQFPERFPAFKYAVAPGARVNGPADFRGKRIITSRGQIAGMLVMRTLAKAGIPQDEVSLVDIAMGDEYYLVALGSGAADIAPLSTAAQTKRFLAMYGDKGGKLIDHNVFRDDMRILYARETLLQDPGKAAALKLYARYVGRAVAWINSHPDRWVQAYYIKTNGLKRTDAIDVFRSSGPLDVPANWDTFRQAEQESIDFLSAETGQPAFDAEQLLDRRFEQVAAQGFRDDQAGVR
jgi:sulfonate transport system substrate-binding protein